MPFWFNGQWYDGPWATVTGGPHFITNVTTSTTSNIYYPLNLTTTSNNTFNTFIVPYPIQAYGLMNLPMQAPTGLPDREESYRVAERQQARALAAQPQSANDRAWGLLLEHLTPSQRDMLNTHGFFVVEGGHSKNNYRIRRNTLVANVDVIHPKSEVITHRLCAHGPMNLPLGDHLLAQKLMLESDETQFLRIANRHA